MMVIATRISAGATAFVDRSFVCCGRICLTFVLSCAFLAAAAHGANSVFDVLYFGGGVASLAPGSDDPNVTTVLPGDSFQWSIAAQDGAYWRVDSDGSFFPLMAFVSDPSADRTGDYTLSLLSDGLEVFAESDSNVVASFVHMGTNSIFLTAGLVFDEMRLDYLLIDAVDNVTMQPVVSSLQNLLPIFGPPEEVGFGSIAYVVPEPAAALLMFVAIGGLLIFGRRVS